MSQLGLGVMINMLYEDKATSEAVKSVLNKKILSMEMKDDSLYITVEDADSPIGRTSIGISDMGQSCCEHRWMHTDDTLSDYIGATLLDIEVVDGPDENESDWGEVRESQFLKVRTDRGDATIVNYNEHNGYYGGFSISAIKVNL